MVNNVVVATQGNTEVRTRVEGDLSRADALTIGASIHRSDKGSQELDGMVGQGIKVEIDVGAAFTNSAGNEARTGFAKITEPDGTIRQGPFYNSNAPVVAP